MEGITSRMDQAEEIICALEERTFEIIQRTQKRLKKSEECLRGMTVKFANLLQ